MASFLVNKTKNRRFMFSITVTQVCSEELSFLLATASFFLSCRFVRFHYLEQSQPLLLKLDSERFQAGQMTDFLSMSHVAKCYHNEL